MKLTNRKLRQLIKEELKAALLEGIDDLHDAASEINSFWGKAKQVLNSLCEYPEQSPIDCANIQAFWSVFNKHPVSLALGTGKLARPRAYKHYFALFKPASPSHDPEQLKSIVDKVAAQAAARRGRR